LISSDGKRFLMVRPTASSQNQTDEMDGSERRGRSNGTAFSFGKSAPRLITGAIQNIGSPRNYDMTPDGKFIIVLNAEQDQNTQSSTPQLNVVLNWSREHQERVPVR